MGWLDEAEAKAKTEKYGQNVKLMEYLNPYRGVT